MDRDTSDHRDAFGRKTTISKNAWAQERFLRPLDGRLSPLVVQGSSDGFSYSTGGREDLGTWKRSGPAPINVSAIIRLVGWTYSSSVALKWLPSCCLLLIMLLWPQNLEGNLRNNGGYDPVRAFDDDYPRVARNIKESRGSAKKTGVRRKSDEEAGLLLTTEGYEMAPIRSRSLAASATSAASPAGIDDDFDDLPSRHSGPRWLCFLQFDAMGRVVGYQTRLVADWIQEHGDADTDFVFVSYTRKQFCVTTPQELQKWNVDPATREALIQIARKDRETLIQYGIEAARAAGKKAFWLDYECIRDVDGLSKATSQSDDVYRICDIVRAAHSMVILVGPSVDSKTTPSATEETYDPEAMLHWLQVWGTRLWTLPEILLVSPERRVKIYAIGGPVTEWSKRHFASRAVWRDGKLVRQLIDHYESSIHLQPLELVSIALECFSGRQTDQFNQGDIVYALMGLLRRRPAVDMSDTSFIAFARVSLANDSAALLERLICLQPTRQDLVWYDQSDFWSAKLWDIEPRCQVAGIVDDETIILDGAYGATIQWDTMEQIYFFKRPTLLRTFGKIIVRGAPLYVIMGLAITIPGSEIAQQMPGSDMAFSGLYTAQQMPATSNILLAFGLIFLIPALITTLFIPALLRHIYLGKFWTWQAHFVGLEGVPSDLDFIEKRLFGTASNRLRWSAAGSALSQHAPSVDDVDERRGLHPLEATADLSAGGEEGHDAQSLPVFTLVDTFSMTVMAFRAARPPSAVIILGQEGGMQRAALCSYDWRRNTFAREQVIRLKTTVLDRMPRIDRFRFSLKRRSPGDPQH